MLNELTLNVQGEQTMSSKEIAELTGKEHRNVLRDCDKLNEEYEKLGLLKIEQGSYTLKNTGDQQHRVMYLTKMQTFDLMTGYNTELRIKVNRRWAELEEEKMKQENEKKRITEPTEYDKEALKARLMEAEAQLLREKKETLQMVTNQVHKEILFSKFYSDETHLLPLPEVGEKSYSATELASMIQKKYGLNLSANKIGRIANDNNLKTSEYGIFLYDKSKYSEKTVESFKYYEKCVDEIVRLFRLETKNNKKNKDQSQYSIPF